MDNLARAMRTRDKDLYESLLDKDFLFTEDNCLGEVEYFNNLEEELEIMGGSRDGSQPGIFDIYRDFSYTFDLTRRSQELGSDYPESFPMTPTATQTKTGRSSMAGFRCSCSTRMAMATA